MSDPVLVIAIALLCLVAGGAAVYVWMTDESE
jgi:hypothetical protein